MSDSLQVTKVYYRPIEAAIRWAGLAKHEREILPLIPRPTRPPQWLDCPRWAELRLYTERIYDGIFNRELPYGRNGITECDEALWESSDLTVRHVDLKKWMRDHYPDKRPGFLFSRAERRSDPIITVEAGQALLIELRTVKADLAHCKHQLHSLHEKHQGLLKQYEQSPACNECPVTNRAETTYQNIIGAMLELLLGESPGGKPYSSFRTQDSVVSALIGHFGGTQGITERTLNGKFAQSRRRVRTTAPETAPK